MRSRSASGIFILLLVLCCIGCNKSSKYQAFIRSHDGIRPGMPISEAFDAGLADYLVLMGNKNVAGGTLEERQPVSATCRRHVLDITCNAASSRPFSVRVFCNMNEPAATEVIPPRYFSNRRELIIGLHSFYRTWAKSMSFRVESPPNELFGVYDHYEIKTDAEGKVASVSPILKSK